MTLEFSGYYPLIANQVYTKDLLEDKSFLVIDSHHTPTREKVLIYLCEQARTVYSPSNDVEEISIRGKLKMLPERTLQRFRKRDSPFLQHLEKIMSLDNSSTHCVRTIQGRIPLNLVERLVQSGITQTISDYAQVLLCPATSQSRPLTYLSWNINGEDIPECWLETDNCRGKHQLYSLVQPQLTPENVSQLHDSSTIFLNEQTLRFLDVLLGKKQPENLFDLHFL